MQSREEKGSWGWDGFGLGGAWVVKRGSVLSWLTLGSVGLTTSLHWSMVGGRGRSGVGCKSVIGGGRLSGAAWAPWIGLETVVVRRAQGPLGPGTAGTWMDLH